MVFARLVIGRPLAKLCWAGGVKVCDTFGDASNMMHAGPCSVGCTASGGVWSYYVVDLVDMRRAGLIRW